MRSDLAVVEIRRALFSDALQRCRELLLNEKLSRLRNERGLLVDADPVLRELNRRRDEILPRQLAETIVHRGEAGDRARNSGGDRAFARLLS